LRKGRWKALHTLVLHQISIRHWDVDLKLHAFSLHTITRRKPKWIGQYLA